MLLPRLSPIPLKTPVNPLPSHIPPYPLHIRCQPSPPPPAPHHFLIFKHHSLQASFLMSQLHLGRGRMNLVCRQCNDYKCLLKICSHYVATAWRLDTHLLGFCSKMPPCPQSSACCFPALCSWSGWQLLQISSRLPSTKKAGTSSSFRACLQ